MKKYTLLCTLLICVILHRTAYSQTPWSLEATAAAGLSSAINSSSGAGSGSQYQLSVQYHIGRISIGAGLAYLRSGYDNNNDSSKQIYTTPNISFYENFRTRHLLVPLTCTYHLPMGSRFSLNPSVGLACSYNISAQISQAGLGLYQKEYKGADFEQYFNRYSLWAQAGLQLSCQANEQLSILAGLQAQSMLTGLQKNVPPGESNLRLFTIFASLGLGYRF